MGGINFGRWLAGGIVAGAIMWVVEGAASLLYYEEMEAALEAVGLPAPEMSASVLLLTILVSLLVGLVIVFFYAASRPRFGPGPRTAALVAFVLWAGGYLVSLVGYRMIGLYPTGMLATWGAVGLIEMILAGIVGAWIYREEEPAAAAA